MDVFVVVLENDGSTLATSLTAAGLALADASIHMFDLIIGASLVRPTLLYISLFMLPTGFNS